MSTKTECCIIFYIRKYRTIFYSRIQYRQIQALSPFRGAQVNRVALNTEKEFSDRQEKALRNNKVLQRILDNPETRKAYINLLDMTLQELKNNEKSNAENKE